MKSRKDCLLIGCLDVDYHFLNEALKKWGIDNNPIEKGFNGAIAYLGSFLAKRGVSYDYISDMSEVCEALSNKLNNTDFTIVAVSSTFCYDLETLKKIIVMIRAIDQDVKILVGGPFVNKHIKTLGEMSSRHLQTALSYVGADYYIHHEQGEDDFLNLINALKRACPASNAVHPAHDVANLIYKHNGTYCANDQAAANTPLEDNMVDWTLFRGQTGKIVPVRTAINCPFACSFCTHRVDTGPYSYVTTQAVERELNSIETLKSVELVNFIDDTFNVPKKRFKDILRLMIEKQYGFEWFSYLRCQYIDEETVQLMKQSRCKGVLLGIESGSQEMLDIMNKKVKVEQLQAGISLLCDYDIHTSGMFILGFPGETHETVQDTIDFINDSQLTCYEVQPWYFHPRTPISKQREQFSLRGSHSKWSHRTMDSVTASSLVDRCEESVSPSKRFIIDFAAFLQILNLGFNVEEASQFLRSGRDARSNQ